MADVQTTPVQTDPVDSLYNRLKTDGFSVPVKPEDFRSMMGTQDYAFKMHRFLFKNKYSVPEQFQDFYGLMNPEKKKEEPEPALPPGMAGLYQPPAPLPGPVGPLSNGSVATGEPTEQTPPTPDPTEDLQFDTEADRAKALASVDAQIAAHQKEAIAGLGMAAVGKFPVEIEKEREKALTTTKGLMYGYYQKKLKDEKALEWEKAQAEDYLKDPVGHLERLIENLKALPEDVQDDVDRRVLKSSEQELVKIKAINATYEGDMKKATLTGVDQQSQEKRDLTHGRENIGIDKDIEANPFVTLGKSGWNTMAYQLPSSMVASAAAGAKPSMDRPSSEAMFPKYYNTKETAEMLGKKRELETQLAAIHNSPTFKHGQRRAENRKKIQAIYDQLHDLDQEIGPVSPTGESITKEAKTNLLIWAADRQIQGEELTKNLISSLDKINDPVDVLNWFSYALGQAAGQIPASVATGGITSMGQEVGSIYLEGVQKIAKEHGLRGAAGIAWVIQNDLDHPAFALAYGTAAGLLDYISAKNVVRMGKQSLWTSLRNRIGDMAKSGGIEAGTEYAQTWMEQIGASQVAGGDLAKAWKGANTNAAFMERLESAAQGAVGGTGLHTVSHLSEKRINAPQGILGKQNEEPKKPGGPPPGGPVSETTTKAPLPSEGVTKEPETNKRPPGSPPAPVPESIKPIVASELADLERSLKSEQDYYADHPKDLLERLSDKFNKTFRNSKTYQEELKDKIELLKNDPITFYQNDLKQLQRWEKGQPGEFTDSIDRTKEIITKLKDATPDTGIPKEIKGFKVIEKVESTPDGEEVFRVEGDRFLTRDGKELAVAGVKIKEPNKPPDGPPPSTKPIGEQVEPAEIQRQMKPITDQMATAEQTFEKAGFDIDGTYDGETIVTSKETGEIVMPEELPEHLKKLAGQYEEANQKLSDFSEQDTHKALEESRKALKGELVPHEVVETKAPSTLKKGDIFGKGLKGKNLTGEGFKMIGTNSDGDIVGEDSNGVRAVKKGDIIISQPINFVPGKGIQFPAPKGEFLITDEEAKTFPAGYKVIGKNTMGQPVAENDKGERKRISRGEVIDEPEFRQSTLYDDFLTEDEAAEQEKEREKTRKDVHENAQKKAFAKPIYSFAFQEPEAKDFMQTVRKVRENFEYESDKLAWQSVIAGEIEAETLMTGKYPNGKKIDRQEVIDRLRDHAQILKDFITKQGDEQVHKPVSEPTEPKTGSFGNDKAHLLKVVQQEGIEETLRSYKSDLDVKLKALEEKTKYQKGKLPHQNSADKDIQSLNRRIEETKRDIEILEEIKKEQEKETKPTEEKDFTPEEADRLVGRKLTEAQYDTMVKLTTNKGNKVEMRAGVAHKDMVEQKRRLDRFIKCLGKKA